MPHRQPCPGAGCEGEVGRNGLESGLQQPKEGGSEGTPATAEDSGPAWTADAQKEPSVSRWRWLRLGARHPTAGPCDTLTAARVTAPPGAAAPADPQRQGRSQRFVSVGFVFFSVA